MNDLLFDEAVKILRNKVIGKSVSYPNGWINADDLYKIADDIKSSKIDKFGKINDNVEDKMPKWMLMNHTEEQLKDLYDALPFVRNDMTFEEFITEWKHQREIYK